MIKKVNITNLTALLTGFALAILLVGSAYAKSLPAKPVFNHVSKDEPLGDLLRSFAGELGLPLTLSKNVSGKVNGKFTDRPTAFMNKIAKVYGLIWYYDGSGLYVYADDEVKTKVIKVRYLTVNELRRNLIRLGVLDPSAKWQSLPRQEIAYVSGPPRFVELAEELTHVLDQKAANKASSSFAVEVFPLKYVLAYDRRVEVRGEYIIVKGVASILKTILSRGSPSAKRPTDGDGNKVIESPAEIPPSHTALVEADERLNAVIISDKKENMPMYAELIDKLDSPANQVEINVSIIEVSTEELSKLGLDFQTTGTDGSASFGSVNSPIPGGGAATGLPPQTVLVGKAGEFLGRVNMMSKEGSAKVLSRPSVLTVDRVEAIIDNSSTFYVRVAGQEEVELFPVTVGSMVRVTPRIVNEEDGRFVHLNVEIEDGNQDVEAAVDNIPQVKKNKISTSAVIGEDSSLLVGGYYYDRQADTESKIPFLGDIPILSFFFNWQSYDVRRVARLFLITPRIMGFKDKGNGIEVSDIVKSFKKLKQGQMPEFKKKSGLGGGSDE